MAYEENEVLKNLPQHLKQFINDQDYDSYTPIDQAVWRYVMRKNVRYLSKVAHKSYTDGLRATGISIEEIPSMYGMNRILKEIGWAAVAVDGFIPPTSFMEFQAYNVLVIAEDIRQLKNIEYTPAPDIIHEAAGHAPIIANPAYSEYLRRFGEIGSKAISSGHDNAVYEAIRHLSIVEENANTSPEVLKEARQRVEDLQHSKAKPSEMSKIRNLHWWTVEYGLIGTLENPKIYGAGLLSSIGESKTCMTDQVEKRWYNIDAANVEFDITKRQPQLYVTPDFAHLSFVLEQFANKMALRKGGLYGINLLIESNHLGTVELNTGLQISGIFTDVIKDENNKPIYIKATGKSALSYRDKEMIGHGTKYHADGYSTVIGKLEDINIPLEKMSPYDLEAYNILEGKKTNLKFEGGITVEGEVITGTRDRFGNILLISFKNCTVKHKDTYLFKPEWGTYDMAVGSTIKSAFAGAADPKSFEDITHVPTEKTEKRVADEAQLRLNGLYQEVREMRNNNTVQQEKLQTIFDTLQKNYPSEWLILVEMNEIAEGSLKEQTKQRAIEIANQNSDIKHLIIEGLEMNEQKAVKI